jgi:hypothetical protein
LGGSVSVATGLASIGGQGEIDHVFDSRVRSRTGLSPFARHAALDEARPGARAGPISTRDRICALRPLSPGPLSLGPLSLGPLSLGPLSLGPAEPLTDLDERSNVGPAPHVGRHRSLRGLVSPRLGRRAPEIGPDVAASAGNDRCGRSVPVSEVRVKPRLLPLSDGRFAHQPPYPGRATRR